MGWVILGLLAAPLALFPGQTSTPSEKTSSKTRQKKKKEDKAPFKLSVVVTDTKIPQAQDHVTQQVKVIEREQILPLTTPNRNLSELLKSQPGTFVNVLSRNDANWGSYGGLGPKYNSYLLDGLPVDGFTDTMNLDPWILERVEVHQGPASVLYSNYMSMDFAGNAAPLAGITNLLTRENIGKASTRMQIGGGSYRTLNGRFYHENRHKNLAYFFGANYEQSDYTNYGTPNSWLNMLDDPEYKKFKIYGKTTYFFNREDHKLSFFFNHADHRGDAGRPNRDYAHGYDLLNAAYSNQINSRVNLQLATGLRNYDRRWGEDFFPSSLALREHDGVQQRIIPTDVVVNITHLSNSVFTLGTDFQHATYQTYAETDGVRQLGNKTTAMSAGLYFQEKYSYKNWILRAGGRFNHTGETYDLISGTAPGLAEKGWNRFLWSTGARYNLNSRAALYLNVGSSFIPPSAKSVGGTLRPDDRGVPGRHGQLPNPDLKPESGLGFDFGTELRLNNQARIGARVFLNRVSDAIVENVISNNPSQSQSTNAGRARSYGLEIPFEYQWLDTLKGFANATFTHSRVENPLDRDQDGAGLSFVPKAQFNAGVQWKPGHGFGVAPYLHVTGTYYDSTSLGSRSSFGPYAELNLRLEKSIFNTEGYIVSLVVDLNNLTNNKYEMPWQFRNPGFQVFSGLQFQF